MKDYRDRSERDHYDRPSWAEIDKRKDRSKHVRDDSREWKEKKKGGTGYSRYKQELDLLFNSGERSGMVDAILKYRGDDKKLAEAQAPERQKLLRAIREAITEKQVNEKISEFIRKFGELPDDIDVLSQALLYEDDMVKISALQKISKYIDGHIIEKKSLLSSRLRNLAFSSEDDRVRELALEIKKKLGI